MENLKSLRKQRDLTQEECARFLGMSRRAYQLLEAEAGRVKSAKYQRCYALLKDAEVSQPRKAIFRSHVLLQEDLLSLRDSVVSLPKRRLYRQLHEFVVGESLGKVCVLYGLSRTGKTTILLQLLSELDLEKTAYLKCDGSLVMADIWKDLDSLKAKGIRYVLLDDITLIRDFVASSATLADIYAKLGIKLILSGDNSLGFALAANRALYDRATLIHTTYIPFGEYRDLFGKIGIEDYLEFGGSLNAFSLKDKPDLQSEKSPFGNADSARRYIDAAIVTNIQDALGNSPKGDGFPNLRTLQEKGALAQAVVDYLEETNHRLLLSIVEGKMANQQPSLARHLSLQEEDVRQIRECLLMLDVIRPVQVILESGGRLEWDAFVQPGLRFAITKGLVHTLLDDPSFSSFTEKERSAIAANILKQIKEKILQDIVLLEMTERKDDGKAFRYRSASGAELIIASEKDDAYRLYEIKYGKKAKSRHFGEEALLKTISSRYGECKALNVLYRGQSQKEDGIVYQNVEDYLLSLAKTGR